MKKYGIMAFLMALVAIPAFVLVGCGGASLTAPSAATIDENVLAFTSTTVENSVVGEKLVARYYEVQVGTGTAARYLLVLRTQANSATAITINLDNSLYALGWREAAMTVSAEGYATAVVVVTGARPTADDLAVKVRAVEVTTTAAGVSVVASDWTTVEGLFNEAPEAGDDD